MRNTLRRNGLYAFFGKDSDGGQMIVMDAIVDQAEGYRFVYCLPFAPDRLLVEDTYYATDPGLDPDAVEARIRAYAESRGHTPLGILTRGVSGIRGRTLIVNFPGSPRAVRQSWPVVEPTLKHAADTLERD